MADAISPEAGSLLFSPTAIDLFSKAIGGTSDQDVTKTGTTTGTQTQAGTSTGTSKQVTDQTTQSTADVEALKQVFAQQQGGITPQMLAAIFAEGQKAAPQLIASTANAVGARAGNNTPLATALTALNAQLTSKAAELDLSQKNASADTAAKIAQLTGGTKTTGTQTGETGQSSNQTGTNNSSSNEKTNNQVDTQPNYGNVGNLLAILLGGSAVNTGLKDFGGIGGAVSQGTNALGGLLQQLLPALGITPSAPSQDFLGQAGNIVGNPGNQLVGTGFGAANPAAGQGLVTDPATFLQELGLRETSSEADFWKSLGVDPAAFQFGSAGSTPGISDTNWFAAEGWDTIDWGG